MTSNTSRTVFWSVLAVVAATLVIAISQRPLQPRATYSEFLKRVQAGEVAKATVEVAARSGVDQIDYTLKNGNRVKTVVPSDDREALAAMRDKLVSVEIRDASSTPLRLLLNATPFLLLLALWVVMMRLKLRPRL
jgi:cell division protease FtsH